MGDPTRFAIFGALAEHPRAVGELATLFPVSRPAVSQHLKILKNAGLVLDRRMGTRRLYAIDPKGVARLRKELDSLWSDALAAFKRAAETWEEIACQ